MTASRLPVLLALLLTLGCTPASPAAPSSTPTRKGVTFTNTVVSLTFDDGAADNYLVRPILARDGLRATFYVVSGFTGSEGYMTASQLRGLYEDGHEIGGHTLNHVKLTEVRGADLQREVCEDRANLQALGFEVTSFAYPFGHYDAAARRAVQECGYSNARGVTDGPEALPPGDAFVLQAMPYVVSDTDLSKLIRYVSGVEKEGGGWVILVFHRVCEACDPYSVTLDTFTGFADWLARQRDTNGLVIRTVREVIEGNAPPLP